MAFRSSPESLRGDTVGQKLLQYVIPIPPSSSSYKSSIFPPILSHLLSLSSIVFPILRSSSFRHPGSFRFVRREERNALCSAFLVLVLINAPPRLRGRRCVVSSSFHLLGRRRVVVSSRRLLVFCPLGVLSSHVGLVCSWRLQDVVKVARRDHRLVFFLVVSSGRSAPRRVFAATVFTEGHLDIIRSGRR